MARKKFAEAYGASFTGFINCQLEQAVIERLFMNVITTEQVVTMIYDAISDGCKFSAQPVDDTGWVKVSLYKIDDKSTHAGQMLTAEAGSLMEALTLLYEKYVGIATSKFENFQIGSGGFGRKPR